MRIMVVDDDMSFLRSITLVLERAGHRVFPFSDPFQALAFARAGNRCDAVLTDVVMPGMRGDRLLCELGRKFRQSCVCCIISGHTDEVGQLDLAALGVRRAFPKPVDLPELLSELTACQQAQKACEEQDEYE